MTKPSRESACRWFAAICGVSEFHMRCSLSNYQHGGSATNKQKLDPQSTQCASPPVVVVDINFHLCARCRLAAIEAIIKSERGTIYGYTTGVFVECAQIHAASERGCWKNQAPHAEHTESGGSTKEKAESHTMRGGNFFTCANVVPVCFARHDARFTALLM